MTNNKPTLSKITLKQGKSIAVGLVAMLIANASKSFNVGKTLTAAQTIESANLILSDFNDWKVANIQQCLDRATAGRYGAIFDRLDCQVIMQWCSAYDLERMEDIALANEKRSGDYKGMVREPFKALEMIKKEEIKDYTSKSQTDSMQNFFSRKYELWERLCEKQPQGSGFRFLNRYGKMLSGAEYVEYKLEQQTRVKEYLKNKK